MILLTTACTYYYDPHFTDEETEAKRVKVTCVSQTVSE